MEADAHRNTPTLAHVQTCTRTQAKCPRAAFQRGRDTDSHMGSQSRCSFLCALDSTLGPILPLSHCQPRAPLAPEPSTCSANTRTQVFSPSFDPASPLFLTNQALPPCHVSAVLTCPRSAPRTQQPTQCPVLLKEEALVFECWHGALKTKTRLHWGNCGPGRRRGLPQGPQA